MMKKQVVVICGGRSAEHEISIQSAVSVLGSLDKRRYEICAVGIGKRGETIAGKDLYDLLSADLPGVDFLPVDDWITYLRSLDPGRTVVFPVLHGPYGEDGTIQGLLELLDLPFVGAGVCGSAVGMNKVHCKSILRDHGLPVLPSVAVNCEEWRTDGGRILERIRSEIGFPLFVKPANMGSSIGVSRCDALSELEGALETAFRYDDIILGEKGVDAREIELSVLGVFNPEVSCPGEIVPGDRFYSYEAKYLDQSSRLIIPAVLPDATAETLRQTARRVFQVLQLEGMARVDFLVERESGRIWVNEANTIPGFTPISMYPKLWAASGIDYPRLLDELLRIAVERHFRRKCLSVDR